MKIIQPHHIHFLQELIAKRSITPFDDGALDLIIKYLKDDYKYILKAFGSNNEQVLNLYLTKHNNTNNSKNTNKNLCFAGHVDVVPVNNTSAWRFDPFKGIIHKNYLYGRGAVDMKSAIVAFIAAVENYHDDFDTISLLLTSDEEGPAKYGTQKMIQWLYENNVKIDKCIVGEPVSICSIGDNIKIGARGSANFVINVYGKQGHVAYNNFLDNPTKAISKILFDIYEYNFMHNNMIFDKTNIEVTTIDCNSGAENITPNSVLLKLNCRYSSDYNYAMIKEIIDNIVLKHAQNYTIDSYSSGDAKLWITNDNSEFLNLIKNSIYDITNKVPQISTYGGTSDARFLRQYCEVIEIGLLGETAHKIDERVSLDDLEQLSQIYLTIITQFFRS